MNLMYLKDSSISQLKQNIMNNKEKYYSAKPWIKEYLNESIGEQNPFIESRVLFEKQDLYMPVSSRDNKDGLNAEIIHKSLKHLTSAQAADERIWTFLAHEIYPEYVSARWIKKDKEITVGGLERYFAYNNKTLSKNAIARLWWGAYLTYDETREDPYELTRLFFKSQDLTVGLLERNMGNNQKWIKAFLSVLLDYDTKYKIIKSTNVQNLMKYLNFFGGVTIFESMNKAAIERMIYKWMEDNKILTQKTQSF